MPTITRSLSPYASERDNPACDITRYHDASGRVVCAECYRRISRQRCAVIWGCVVVCNECVSSNHMAAEQGD